MYYYVVVCILCWLPTLAFYITALSGYQSMALDMVARCSLYLTGFFNFLVYCMQDRYLRAAFRFVLQFFGCGRFVSKAARPLKKNHKDKTVMFDQTVTDVQKEKNSVYKHRRLSREDKSALYALRPDLNLQSDLEESLLSGCPPDSDSSFLSDSEGRTDGRDEDDEERKERADGDWDDDGDMHEDNSDSDEDYLYQGDSSENVNFENAQKPQNCEEEEEGNDIFHDALEGSFEARGTGGTNVVNRIRIDEHDRRGDLLCTVSSSINNEDKAVVEERLANGFR